MHCPSCGSESQAGARFCMSCGTPLAAACASCGTDLPPEARFCASCGTAVGGSGTEGAAETPGDAPMATETRKVVSVVFVDLVGFTADTEQSDPEDVRARLTAYHHAVRADVERYGGKVEKLMGDGVFAVFGVPVAHEDDPERAVRAALRIQQSIADMNAAGGDLSVRIAVTTGEAIIQYGDDGGEGIIGDVVNTASRLEALAPPGGVVADHRTYVVSHRSIDFEAMDPVVVKGKAEPLTIWRAVGARSRFGVGVEEHHDTPFLGRDRELADLIDALGRAGEQRSIQLVTITGEPGVGKSRLINEFFRHIDEQPDLVYWRQGRCLPYGEGITFWAVGEILKAHAGILDGEPPATVAGKWSESVRALFPDEKEAAWVSRTLGPLVGLHAEAEAGDGAEIHAAGRALIEAVAEHRPLVLLVEDLHWADPALIRFLEHLLDWVSDSPVLMVVTARPELHTDFPAWGGGGRNAVTLALSPLSDDVTAELLADLMPSHLMTAERQAELLERCGGNPLYAIEYARLVAEGGTVGDLPAGIEALVAARLDLLTEAERAFVQAAAVIGKVFWAGAVEFVLPDGARDPVAVLRSLSSRELIRPIRRSSMQGHDEFTFWHVLIRDVAYGQIPKAERARLHERVATWLEVASAERATDAAELIVHHYATAIELGRLGSGDRPDVFANAYRFSMVAADRSRHIDADRALQQLRRAVEYASGSLERGRAFTELGLVAMMVGELDEAEESAARGAEELAGTSDRLALAQAVEAQSRIAWLRGAGERADAFSAESVALVDGLPEDETVARILISHGGAHMLRGRSPEALAFTQRGLAMARRFGDRPFEAKALAILGSVHAHLADLELSVGMLREALDLTIELGATTQALSAYNNLSTELQWIEGPDAALEVIEDGILLAEQRGQEGSAMWSRMTKAEHLILGGRLPELDGLLEEVLAWDDARGGSQIGIMARTDQAMTSYLRDQVKGAWARVPTLLEDARKAADPQILVPPLALAAAVAFEVGDRQAGIGFVREFRDLTAALHGYRGAFNSWFADGLASADGADLLEELAGVDMEFGPVAGAVHRRAAARLAEEAGDLEEAIHLLEAGISVCDRFGLDIDRAAQRTALARCLLAKGEDGAAGALLDEAVAIAEPIGAALLVRHAETLRGEAGEALGA